jgi:hypothetical protein
MNNAPILTLTMVVATAVAQIIKTPLLQHRTLAKEKNE